MGGNRKRREARESKYAPGTPDIPRRTTKAKGRDYTDPFRHRVYATGGPIERRFLSTEEMENRGLTNGE